MIQLFSVLLCARHKCSYHLSPCNTVTIWLTIFPTLCPLFLWLIHFQGMFWCLNDVEPCVACNWHSENNSYYFYMTVTALLDPGSPSASNRIKVALWWLEEILFQWLLRLESHNLDTEQRTHLSQLDSSKRTLSFLAEKCFDWRSWSWTAHEKRTQMLEPQALGV